MEDKLSLWKIKPKERSGVVLEEQIWIKKKKKNMNNFPLDFLAEDQGPNSL